MKSWGPHIILIRDALAHIDRYRPTDEATFFNEVMVQDAILMRLQTIGENLAQMRRIDEERFTMEGDDSWNQLIGLRNVISHGYHYIRPDRIWQIIMEELPQFAASINDMLDE